MRSSLATYANMDGDVSVLRDSILGCIGEDLAHDVVVELLVRVFAWLLVCRGRFLFVREQVARFCLLDRSLKEAFYAM